MPGMTVTGATVSPPSSAAFCSDASMSLDLHVEGRLGSAAAHSGPNVAANTPALLLYADDAIGEVG